jgi:hypothetical protein
MARPLPRPSFPASKAEIDAIAFDLYGFSEADRAVAQVAPGAATEKPGEDVETTEDDAEDEDGATPIDQTAGLLSWAGGVAFGPLRLASGDGRALVTAGA